VSRRRFALRFCLPPAARLMIESSERLGRKRWVVDRTSAWLRRFRRLLVRYERRADVQQAFVTLASGIIVLRAMN
jgi:transposase